MNTVNLIGRLTKDPLLQQTRSGHSVTSICIAVDRDYTVKGAPRQETDFFTVVAWNDKAQFVAKYFRVGQRIGVSGHLQSRDYTDKNGNKRTAIEVVATSIDFAGDAPKRKQEPEQPPLPEEPPAAPSPQPVPSAPVPQPAPEPVPTPAKTESDFQFLDEDDPDDDFDFVL